jgi:hypothetical protein
MLAVLPFLTLAVLFAVTCAYTPPPPQSGDALLDALLVDFDQRGTLPWTSPELTRQNSDHGLSLLLLGTAASFRPDASAPPNPGPSLLTSIDNRFTGDPRYWLLLGSSQRSWWALPAAVREQSGQPGADWHNWFYAEAARYGTTSVALQASQLLASDDPWVKAAARSQPGVPYAPRDPWPVKRWEAESEAFRAASAGTLDRQLELLLQLGPDDAAACYVAARYETQRGNLQRAFDRLRSGNRLPKCSSFAALDTQRFWKPGCIAPANSSFEEMVFGNYFARSIPAYVPWRDMVKRLAYDAAQRNDRDGLQAVHEFSCRFATDGAPSFLTNLVGVTFCKSVANALQTCTPVPLSAADTRQLNAAQQQLGQLSAQLKQFNTAVGLPNWRHLNLALVENALSAGDTGVLYFTAMAYDQEQQERQNCARLVPLWDKLAAFDYRTLQFEATASPMR